MPRGGEAGRPRHTARIALLGLCIAFAGAAAAAWEPWATQEAGARAKAKPAAAKLVVHRGLRYQGRGEPTLDIFRPRGVTGRLPGVMVVHGGNWTHGDSGKMARVGKAIARRGFVVINVRFTFSTPSRGAFPRQPKDLRRALRWVRGKAKRLRLDPRRIGALGSSSGAHLVGVIATKGRGSLARGGRVGAAVTWSAPFDFTKLRKYKLAGAIKRLLGCRGSWCRRKKLVAASPVKHVSADDSPMLMFHGSREFLPLAQPRAMARRFKAVGVPHEIAIVPGTRHGMKYQLDVRKRTIRYFRAQLASPPGT